MAIRHLGVDYYLCSYHWYDPPERITSSESPPIHYYYYYIPCESFKPDALSLETKWQQISSTLLDIINNGEISMVSIILPIINSSSLLCKILGTVPSPLTKIVISATLMIHCLLGFPARSKYLSPSSLTMIFTLWSAGPVKSTI